MKYATIIKGKVNLIVCDKEFAETHSEVIQVPDNVYSGWIDNGDGTYSPPEDKPDSPVEKPGKDLNLTTLKKTETGKALIVILKHLKLI